MARYYANAWLMTHFLIIGNINNEYGLRVPLAEFLFSYRQGRDPLQSFPEIFGMSTSEMDALITRYIQGGRLPVLRFNREDYEYKGEIESRKMNSAETSYILASLASDMSLDELVEEYFQEEKDALPAEAAALYAVISGHGEEYMTADSQAAYASDQPSLNVEALAALSHYWLDYAVERDSGENQREDALQKAVALGDQAIELNAGYIEGYYYLAKALEAQGDTEKAEQVLWGAHDRYAGSLILNSYLLQLLLVNQESEKALAMIDNIYSAIHVAESRAKLAELRETIKSQM